MRSSSTHLFSNTRSLGKLTVSESDLCRARPIPELAVYLEVFVLKKCSKCGSEAAILLDRAPRLPRRVVTGEEKPRPDRASAAEQAVGRPRSSRKVQRTGIATAAAIAPLQTPQPVDSNVITLPVLHRSQVVTCVQIESADRAVAEIADNQGIAEGRNSLRSPPLPRQIHPLIVRNQALEQVPVEVEDVDQPGPGLQGRNCRSRRTDYK